MCLMIIGHANPSICRKQTLVIEYFPVGIYFNVVLF